MTDQLSLAAQAVLDAANGASSWGPDDCLNDAREIAAAALRAAADQAECSDPDDNAFAAGYDAALGDILSIAAKLEAR